MKGNLAKIVEKSKVEINPMGYKIDEIKREQYKYKYGGKNDHNKT